MNDVERVPQELQVLCFPEQSLGMKSVEVTDLSLIPPGLIDDMFLTMEKHGGVGLAAPQVGRNIRLAVINFEGQKLVLINPQIQQGWKKTSEKEGCLSIPGYEEWVERFSKIDVTYQDAEGNVQVLMGVTGRRARIIQHEVDHLAGMLFVDRMSNLKKSFFKSWINKKLKMFKKFQANKLLMEKLAQKAGVNVPVEKDIKISENVSLPLGE